MSAEPKGEVLPLCKYLSQLHLDEIYDYRKALKACYNTKILDHLRSKNWNTSIEELENHIEEVTIEGFILGLFRYVAELRDRPVDTIVDFPGYKDPKDLLNMAELRQYLPNSWFINMVRKGQDVAYSKLNHFWGATNPVAGAFYWRRQMKKGLENKEKIKKNRYLELRLEDLYDDFTGYCNRLDHFVYKATGRSDLNRLEEKLQYFAKPYSNYESNGLQKRIINYIVFDINKSFGYNSGSEVRKNNFYEILTIFYLIIDFPLRLINFIVRKTGLNFIKPFYIK